MNPEELEVQLRQQVEPGSHGASNILSSLGDGLGDVVESAVDIVPEGALDSVLDGAGELLGGILGSIFDQLFGQHHRMAGILACSRTPIRTSFSRANWISSNTASGACWALTWITWPSPGRV